MSKSKFFTAVITVVSAAVILFVIINSIFNKNSKINQGNFRISDALITSTVELEDKSEGTNKWEFDVSQSNKISMLVQTSDNAKIKETYLEEFKVGSKNNVSIYIEQNTYELNYKYDDIKNKKVNIYTEEREDGNYLIEFDIKNEDILSNYAIPEDVKEIRYDGTILNIAKVPISTITFNVRYNLVIVEDKGGVNKCKVSFSVPDSKIVSEGLFVERMDVTELNFKVNY